MRALPSQGQGLGAAARPPRAGFAGVVVVALLTVIVAGLYADALGRKQSLPNRALLVHATGR